MTEESDRRFNDRRAAEERSLADQTTDSLSSIPHDRLSKLHADEARAIADAQPSTATATALDVTDVNGGVTIAVAGVLTSLTPDAALLTSDRLLAGAHRAGRRKAPV